MRSRRSWRIFHAERYRESKKNILRRNDVIRLHVSMGIEMSNSLKGLNLCSAFLILFFFRSGLYKLSTIYVWSWIIPCCGGLSCALLDV